MKKTLMALALVLAGAAPAAAQPAASHVAAAREFLEASRSRESFERAFEMGLQEGAQGEITPEQMTVVREVMAEHFSWAELEGEYVDMYVELLSEDELRALTEFYRTPAGQKLASVTPEIALATQRITNARLQAMMPELMSRLIEMMSEEGET